MPIQHINPETGEAEWLTVKDEDVAQAVEWMRAMAQGADKNIRPLSRTATRGAMVLAGERLIDGEIDMESFSFAAELGSLATLAAFERVTREQGERVEDADTEEGGEAFELTHAIRAGSDEEEDGSPSDLVSKILSGPDEDEEEDGDDSAIW